ncbi:MAG TPA: phosphoglycerate dehydrogenase [Glaciihabitans sp.]|jgi:D-3-phosphoglycerate dehydrogenase|nr:phosphoglycerate dehydrogenase [Glaciihabitans sp.]
MNILITTPSFGAQSNAPWDSIADAGLTVRRPVAAHPLSSTQLADEVGDASALIVGLDTVDAEVFARGTNLKVVAKHGVGVDNIDLEAAKAAGVRVVNAPGSNSGAVADLTFGLMLALARQVLPAHQSMLEGKWDRFPGIELSGRTLGLVGFGRIGQAVAKRASGFDMTVIAYDPYLPAHLFAEAGAQQVGLEEVVAEADFLSLHMPGGANSAPILSAQMLATTKPGSFLINAARGGLVDEDALAALLVSGHLRGAALDAFNTEPLGPSSALLGVPNLILTPHIGAFSDLANANMGVMVAEDVARVLRGDEPLNAVV